MYDHGSRNITVATAASLASLAVIGSYTNGYMPFTLRAVTLVFTTAAGAVGICLVKKRPTAGSASGESTVATINFDGTSGAQGKVIYKDGLDVIFAPGDQLVFEITDVAATGAADCGIFIQDRWEVPANNTDMAVTT
jgi:hypothetical protein